MNRGPCTRWLLLAFAALLPGLTSSLHAQQPPQQESSPKPQESSSKQGDPDAPEALKPLPKKLPPPGKDEPTFDPLRAEKDIEVGRYYMHRGDLDAAIDRFQDATKARPNYALPFRLLGEAQEKKGRKRDALKSYTRYLEIFPGAEDAEKVRRRIEKLREASEKERRKSGEPVQELPRARIIGETLFFFSKFARMGNQTAP